MFVLALGSFGCVGVGFLAECVTAFKPEVVSFVVVFVSAIPFVSGSFRVAPMGVDTGVGICGGVRFVVFLGEGVVFSRDTSFSSIFLEHLFREATIVSSIVSLN